MDSFHTFNLLCGSATRKGLVMESAAARGYWQSSMVHGQ
jgi:hypothetical protein